MISAAAYVLKVPEGRRNTLLRDGPDSSYSPAGSAVAEPVAKFDHSRRAPLVVFACFEDDAITHIADGRKGASAGTGLVRLNMREIEALARPVLFSELRARAGAPAGTHRQNSFLRWSIATEESGRAIDILLELEPGLGPRLARFSERRTSEISRLTSGARTNLALQKETLTAALQIAGFGTEEVLTWLPSIGEGRSFLEGLPRAYAREDAALISDLNSVPGFNVIKNFSALSRNL